MLIAIIPFYTFCSLNKRKIINDPVYGFISLEFDFLLDLLEHPYFQRLRHIQQLGLGNYVYPGAVHTRFHHALGALHLMQRAVRTRRHKGVSISSAEAQAVCLAILLHDVGHGPFSHALEHALVPQVSHEDISLLLMQRLNTHFNGQLNMAIEIFENRYPKKFLHQLVSSQLDMDRLDYLTRDSFFSGVQEGVIGYDRIIKMLNVHQDELLVEEKGIYSIEKFLISRRLMYWQVYLHKTVLCAEMMLVHILTYAKELAAQGTALFASPALQYFLYENDHIINEDFIRHYTHLDDHDLWCAIKVWQAHSDALLAEMCTAFVQRRLLKIELQREPFAADYLEHFTQKLMQHKGYSRHEAAHLVFGGTTSNRAYSTTAENIKILFKDGKALDIAEASDLLNIQALAAPVVKHYCCYPKYLITS